MFDVDNSLSSHTDNQKNDFLILGEGPTFGINRSFGSPEKKFSINFSNVKTKFCLRLHYNGDNSYLFVNEREIYKLKLVIKMIIFHLVVVPNMLYLINLTMLIQKKYL